MRKINRKRFIKNTALGLTAGLLSSCGIKENRDKSTKSDKVYRWKMATTWPPNFPVLGEGALLFSKWVEEMSGGRMQIKVFGGGELLPALQVFDAVSEGSIEMGNGASYYWTGKMPAAAFFCTVPFGMNAQQMNAWLYAGGGLELWKELYQAFDVVPMPAGNTGVQMGGWYAKEINNASDFQGLKIRMPGLGGRVIEKMGGSPVLKPGGELFTSLERGVIDATEWIGPYHDYLMGFYKAAPYYYGPGWHEPGSCLENIVHKPYWDELPSDLKAIIETASTRLNIWTLSQFEGKNNEFLQKIKNETDVQIKTFNSETLTSLKLASKEVIEEIAQTNALSSKIAQSYLAFQEKMNQWAVYSEKEFYTKMI